MMREPDDLRDVPYLYLTTTGRTTGLPREIEIWFVARDKNLYVLAEHFHKAQWVRNILRTPRVRVRVAGGQYEAAATVLDPVGDAAEWQAVQACAREKYGWGDGLPVRITPDAPVERGATTHR